MYPDPRFTTTFFSSPKVNWDFTVYQRQKFIAVCAESRNLPLTAKNRKILHIPRNTAKFIIYRDNREFSIIFAPLFCDICIIIHYFKFHCCSSKFEHFPRNQTICYKYQTRCYNLSTYTICYKIRKLVIKSGQMLRICIQV